MYFHRGDKGGGAPLVHISATLAEAVGQSAS